MPIIIPRDLPANEILAKENVFVMNDSRALSQDIRPLKIAILNLMPTKIVTESQLLRLLANTPLQIEIDLINTKTYQSKNTSQEHLQSFYKNFDEIQNNRYDGMIITGAPIEHLDFEDVDYWPELTEIFDFTRENVYSTMHICWGAQGALNYYYDIPKYHLPEKMFGVFNHRVLNRDHKLVRGFDDEFFVPHSRHTTVFKEDIQKIEDLEILAESDDAGVYLLTSKDGRQIYITGHSEYDPLTLKSEYDRDINKGLEINVPINYFPDNDPKKEPLVKWRGHSNLLFSNWLNYYVYQETPFDLSLLPQR